MTQKFRVVRQFGGGLNKTVDKAYRVETTDLLTEKEAFKLMKDLDSPYLGRKYPDEKETK